MRSAVVSKEDEYIFNNCSKYLARDNTDIRHDYFGFLSSQRHSRICESWRFPIIDAHDDDPAHPTGVPPSVGNYEFNDVTFVYAGERDGDGSVAPQPAKVELVATCLGVNRPQPLRRVADSLYWSVSLKVPKGQRHRYVFVVDGARVVDPINPQTQILATGEVWSSFFTWAYNEPITFERWEFVLVDRLTRHILPFNDREGRNFQQRQANAGNDGHLYRLDVSVGVANYIDKLLAREERHQLTAYKTCLGMLADVLRKRNPGRDPATLEEAHFVRLYHEMADINRVPALIADGWDQARYGSPSYFLYLLRRHAWTGAFAHPKYGGNPGGMAWAFLAERFHTSANPAATAFDWPRGLERPLGTSGDYWG